MAYSLSMNLYYFVVILFRIIFLLLFFFRLSLLYDGLFMDNLLCACFIYFLFFQSTIENKLKCGEFTWSVCLFVFSRLIIEQFCSKRFPSAFICYIVSLKLREWLWHVFILLWYQIIVSRLIERKNDMYGQLANFCDFV